MSANKPALPLELIPLAFFAALLEFPCKRDRPTSAAARLAVPDDSAAAAVVAPVPCWNPLGGRNHGGVGGAAVASSNFLLSEGLLEVPLEF